MRNVYFILLFFALVLLNSCSVDSFQVRKNFQPRVRVTVQENKSVVKVDPVIIQPKFINDESAHLIPLNPGYNPVEVQPTIKTKTVDKLIPVKFKKTIQVKKPSSKPSTIKKTKTTKDDSVVGLVLNLIALA